MVAQDIEAWTAKAAPSRLGARDEADVRWFWNEAEAEFGMRSNFGMQIEMLQLYNMSDGHKGLTDDERSDRARQAARKREFKKKNPAVRAWRAWSREMDALDWDAWQGKMIRQRAELREAKRRFAEAFGKDAAAWLTDGWVPLEYDVHSSGTHEGAWTNPWTDHRIDAAGRYRFIRDVMTALDVDHIRALWLVYGPEMDEVRGCAKRVVVKATAAKGAISATDPDPRHDDPVHRPHYARLADLTLVAEDTDEAQAAATDGKTTARTALSKRIDKEDILRLRIKNAAENIVAASCRAYVAARGPEKYREESWAKYRRRRVQDVG